MTVEPYAIANNLPDYLVSGFEISAGDSPRATLDYFCSSGKLSDLTMFLGWEHAHYPPILSALLASYYADGKAPPPPVWSSSDYDPSGP